MSVLRAAQVFRHLANKLAETGHTITDERPTPQFVEEMSEMGKRRISSMMVPWGSDVSSANSFWLGLRKHDELIGTAAGRLEMIGPGEAGEFLQYSQKRHWCQSEETTVSVEIPEHVSRKLSGKVVYMGDFFFREGTTGDKQKTINFSNAANALAFLTWPDAVALYAFVSYADQLDKVGHYGFTSGSYLGVIHWSNPPAGRSDDECLCLLTREDFNQNSGQLAAKPSLIMSPPQRRSRLADRKSK